MNEVEFVRITTVIENDSLREDLASVWGLSFFVEFISEGKRRVILMDTSGSIQALIHNFSKLDLTLSEVEAIFVSHWHSDHYGALSDLLPLLKPQTTVYVPSENDTAFLDLKEAKHSPCVCKVPTEIFHGIMSTGEMSNGVSEHSLLINVKNKGLVILVGCSHPGIINILKHAQKVSGIDKIYAVMGGFHISSFREGIKVGNELQKLDVKLISPCHCTSDNAKQGIANVVKEKYQKNGSGRIISVNPKESN